MLPQQLAANAVTMRAAVARGVFDGVTGPALLATGRTVEISDATPDDFERVRQFYEDLGDTSTYFRFFGIRRSIPEAELRAVVSHEIPRHVTLLATMTDRLIGIGEFIIGDEPTEAELAFAVADDHHHEGVATLLLERLATVARRCGLERLTAKTMFGNQDMLLVFRTVGLTRHTVSERDEVNVTLDLTSLHNLEARAKFRHALALRALADRCSPWTTNDAGRCSTARLPAGWRSRTAHSPGFQVSGTLQQRSVPVGCALLVSNVPPSRVAGPPCC